MNWYVGQGKTINCIAKSAYSMGFVIFQNCTNRYVMTSTTLHPFTKKWDTQEINLS